LKCILSRFTEHAGISLIYSMILLTACSFFSVLKAG